MIEAAARMAVRRAGRLRPVSGYTRDDALQDARIGAWRAIGQDTALGMADDALLSLMAFAGYRNILDGRDGRWIQTGGGARQHDIAEAPEPVQPDTAAELIHVGQMLEAIARMRHPLPHLASMLIRGYTQTEAARKIGMDEATMSRHGVRLRAQVGKLMGVTT